MKNILLYSLAISAGIALFPGLSYGQTTNLNSAPDTNAVKGLEISLAEQAATVRQIAEDAAKGFDRTKHVQDLTRRINEILATIPPPPASEPAQVGPAPTVVKAPPTGGQPAQVQGPMRPVPAGEISLPTNPRATSVAASLRQAMGELEQSVRRLKAQVDQISERAEQLPR